MPPLPEWAVYLLAFAAAAALIWGTVLRPAQRNTTPLPPPIILTSERASLSEDEKAFRDALMGRVLAAEGEIRELKSQMRGVERELRETQDAARQQLHAAQERELMWQGWAQMFRTQYLDLVRLMQAGGQIVDIPPPPPPPPPPEGSGGGYLLTGPSPRPRQLPSGPLNELLDILAGTALSGPVTARDALLAGLPLGYRNSLQRSGAPRADLADMIERAALHGGDPPLLGALLDNMEGALGGTESEPGQQVRKWRLRNRW